MSESEISARLIGPLASADNNFAAAIGTTHAVYAIPEAWKRTRLAFTVRCHATSPTATVWLIFGTGVSVEADRTAVVTGTPPAWVGNAKIARPLRDGETADYYVKSSWTHFSIESDDNTNQPTIYAFPSDDRAGVLASS